MCDRKESYLDLYNINWNIGDQRGVVWDRSCFV